MGQEGNLYRVVFREWKRSTVLNVTQVKCHEEQNTSTGFLDMKVCNDLRTSSLDMETEARQECVELWVVKKQK